MSDPLLTSCPTPCAEHPRVAAARGALLDSASAAALADLFRALGDATRAKIITCLLHQDLCTCDLALLMGITESAISQHLRVLRALRLVTSQRRGKLVFHAVADAHVALLVQVGLSHVQEGDAHHPMMAQLLTHLMKGATA
ncbi:MAG: helix-turn-helix transcriptional regulator [Ktedonobacterales bacterium]|nr:helix-turn-helix transcriptional regulator [Ktedonobacterales bacterium]